MEKKTDLHTLQIEIRDYEPRFYDDFCRLNTAWISEYWHVEERDVEEMQQLRDGIEGGFFFVALHDGRTVGTIAMLPMDGQRYDYELAKFTTDNTFRGQGIGRMLMQTAIGTAEAVHKGRIFIATNNRCHSAIHLYEQFGFCRLPGVSDIFERGDYLMERISVPAP